MKKDITLDDLAEIIQRGFLELNDRFEKVDQQFIANNRDHAAIRWTLTELAYKDEVRGLEDRVVTIEKHLGIELIPTK